MISFDAAHARLFSALRKASGRGVSGGVTATQRAQAVFKTVGSNENVHGLHRIRAIMNNPAEAKTRLGSQALIKGVSTWFLPSH